MNSKSSISREISLKGSGFQTYTGSYLSDSYSTHKKSNQAEPPVYIIIDKNYLGIEHESHKKTTHAPLRKSLGFSPALHHIDAVRSRDKDNFDHFFTAPLLEQKGI